MTCSEEEYCWTRIVFISSKELNEVFTLENKEILLGHEQFITFVAKWERKYPILKKYRADRDIAYFTYMD